ncbi:PKD domain-containing protein [Candidatus Poribacteria bacterium]
MRRSITGWVSCLLTSQGKLVVTWCVVKSEVAEMASLREVAMEHALLTITLVISFALSASGAAMEFRTFTNPDMGIQGILPVGWTEREPGEFTRGTSDADETVLVQLGVPNITIEQMKVFLLPRLKVEELPESTRSIKNDNFSWDLYNVESEGLTGEKMMVDMALAQANGWVYLALLGTMPDERDDLYYAVFMRALDALEPLVTGKPDKQEHKEVVKGVKADVILVKGEKLENDACNTVAEMIKAELGLSTAFVDLESLGEVDLQKVKLIFFPGGDYVSIRLPEKILVKVQKAVAAGTGYIGICCGAFMAADTLSTSSHTNTRGTGDSFCIFPGMAEVVGGQGTWPFYFDTQHPVVANSSVADRISPVMDLRFVGGTSNLTPSYSEAMPNWCLATIDKPSEEEGLGARAAITTTVFGKGRVLLSAPHPEAHADTRALTLAAVEWCTGRSDPENNQSPLIQADIPSEGIVNHLFVCSAAGSRDPNGLPIGFIWYFGDASPKQYRPEAVHVYQQPGTYTVTLTVTTGSRHSIKSTEVIIHEPQ